MTKIKLYHVFGSYSIDEYGNEFIELLNTFSTLELAEKYKIYVENNLSSVYPPNYYWNLNIEEAELDNEFNQI